MHASSAGHRSTRGRTSRADYDPAEHAVDRLAPAIGASSALCVVFLMLLVAL